MEEEPPTDFVKRLSGSLAAVDENEAAEKQEDGLGDNKMRSLSLMSNG